MNSEQQSKQLVLSLWIGGVLGGIVFPFVLYLITASRFLLAWTLSAVTSLLIGAFFARLAVSRFKRRWPIPIHVVGFGLAWLVGWKISDALSTSITAALILAYIGGYLLVSASNDTQKQKAIANDNKIE